MDDMTPEQQEALRVLKQFGKATVAGVQAFQQAFEDALLEEVPGGGGPIVVPPTPVVILPRGGENRTDLQLVWHEQFDKDLSSWRRGSRDKANGLQASPGYGTPDNHEIQFYHPDQLTVSQSQMTLEAKLRYVKVYKVAENDPRKGTFKRNDGTKAVPDEYWWPYYEGTFPYQSAWASTGPDDNGWASSPQWTPSGSIKPWKYGWIEASVQQPKGQGFWTAMWMLRDDQNVTKSPDEIDIFEYLDPNGKKVAFHLHTDRVKDWTADEGAGKDVGVDVSEGFHTYAVDWTPEYIRWYFDGKLVQERTAGQIDIPDAAMYLIFNFAVGGDKSWPGSWNAKTPTTAKMIVDYVRVWQKKAI